MNKVIWKFPLETTDNQNIELPKGAEILTVQMQNGTPCLWALVDPNEETKERRIEIFATGQSIPYRKCNAIKYISTYQTNEGLLVFHVFELL